MDEAQVDKLDDNQGKSKTVLIASAVLILLVLAGSAYYFLSKNRKTETTSDSNSTTSSATTNQTTTAAKEVWQDGQVAIAGNFADAEIADLGDGRFRLYYSIEPEVPNNKLEVYSAVSADGKNWTKEDGIRKTFATFPDVIKLPDGTWRMYFQNAGVIKSATSADGLSWTDEPGIRVDKTESGFEIENVGAQSTTILDDGSFAMMYRGAINQTYTAGGKVPNTTTDIYFWATSKDGLSWQKQGLAIDSRNSTLLGMADGAEWVKWDDGQWRVYFWGYAGIYHSVFADGKFSTSVFDFTNNKDSQLKFAPDPPGDPTLAKIPSTSSGQATWFMYYGQHTKGIYFTTLK